MKKNKPNIKFLSIAALFALVGGLASCTDVDSGSSDNDSDSSDTSGDASSSSSSPTPVVQDWKEEEKELIKKYCGEVLPYPNGMVSGTVTVNEIHDYEQDFSYLQIYDQGETFSLKEYYKTLENAGWSTIETYGAKKVQVDTSGILFVELTKASEDGKEGYDIIYSFDTCNVIHCYTGMSGKATSNTAWSEAEAASIKKVTTLDLPFIALGEDYWVSATNLNNLEIYDIYTEDLTKKYAEMLQDEGFVLSRPLSTQYSLYYLVKYLDNGATLEAVLYYYGGNTFTFSYSGEATAYSSWPTELTDQIKKDSGVDIPQFKIAEGGTYLGYKKADTYFIYTYDLLSGYNYETYSLNELRNPALSWEETVSFMTYNLTDNDDNTVGYMVMIEIIEPTSTFVTSWPEEKINDTLTNLLEIDSVALPEIDTSAFPETGKDIKYFIRGQEMFDQYYEYYYEDITAFPSYYGLENPSEEEIKAEATRLSRVQEGIYISVFDVSSKAYQEVVDALYKAGWYETNVAGYVTYEDPTGQLMVTLDTYQNPSHDYEGVTTIFIRPGYGKAHTAEFYFEDESYNVGIGLETNLSFKLKKNMYPYDVTYTSNNEAGGISVNQEGIVTVDENVKVGTTATITASITLPDGSVVSASCEVTAVAVTVYTPSEVIDKLDALIKAAGYETTVVHTKLIDNVTVNFGTDLSVEEIEKLADSKFALSDFDRSDDGWVEKEDYVDDDEITGHYIRYDYQVEGYCWIWLEYFIYTMNGSTYLRITAI